MAIDAGEIHLGGGEEEDSRGKKRFKMAAIDRFGELPDSLVIDILSFLNVKEAAITSVLSKRWEFLWAELTRLEFRGIGLNFVSGVNRTLGIRRGRYLEKFGVELVYHSMFSCDVDAWVEFATENKVKELNLHLCGGGELYRAPESLYSCASLTTLHVAGCIMIRDYKIRTRIEWHSLTHLYLQGVEVGQSLVDEILSGRSCPVLYILILTRCRGFNRLEVNCPSLHILKIDECEYDNVDAPPPPLKILAAPYTKTLINICVPAVRRRKLQVRNMSSFVTADIHCGAFSEEEEVMGGAIEFLESIQHVKLLILGLQFIKLVSKMMALTHWHLPQSRIEVLVLNSDCDNIPAIIGFLESSPNLKTLVIQGCASASASVGAEYDLRSDVSHLKSVIFRKFADSKGEWILALARILLKRATALEEMAIMTNAKDLSGFITMVQTMRTYPTSSTNPLIHLLDFDV